MRQGEILATRWEWVDFANRRIRLPDTKNGTARDVPLSRKAELVLRRLDEGRRTGLVFPTTRSAFRQAFGDARDKAGITDLRFHDFRHDATTRIAKRVRNVRRAWARRRTHGRRGCARRTASRGSAAGRPGRRRPGCG
ncbi:tyrosine-type recombinase/integrase [Pelomonas aquatica]|uniref:tyrosine-type recombinase/integrase n=1 Tax=Pelomonas aquatica TaxID=431058 RepID=UPI0038F799F2